MDYLILDENHISIGVNEVEVQVIIFVEIFTYVIDDLVQVKLLPIVMVVVLIIIKVWIKVGIFIDRDIIVCQLLKVDTIYLVFWHLLDQNVLNALVYLQIIGEIGEIIVSIISEVLPKSDCFMH